MATDKKLPRLIINKMNQEQFETVAPSEDELYLVEETKEYATIEQLETKQDTLVSGTNIKTINGEDVLGEGDLKLSTYHPPLLSCMWSDHLIDDMSWLQADTFSWQDGNVYKTVYDKLVEEYNAGTQYVDYGVTFRKTPSRYKISLADQEQNILNHYNEFGISWFYILDIPNKRFKLPRTKWGFKGLRSDVGDGIEESLPNIKGYFASRGVSGDYSGAVTGAEGTFSQNRHGATYTSSIISIGSSVVEPDLNNFDASRSSSTYQDNAPVQERATQMYLYFYVGEYAREAIEQTAGLNAELFNGKADTSYVNNGLDGKVSKTGDTMSGALKITGMDGDNSGQARIIYGNGYGVMLRNDGASFYMLITNKGDVNGTWNNLRPFSFTLDSGYTTISGTECTALGKPSTKNYALTPATGSAYQAPTPGYFTFVARPSASNSQMTYVVQVTNANGIHKYKKCNVIYGNRAYAQDILPVCRGDRLVLESLSNGAWDGLAFIYAEGLPQ